MSKELKIIFENWRKFLNEETANQNLKLFFLIGPPSVGKSEWVKKEGPRYDIVNPYTISMDDMTELVGNRHGFDYDSMFEKPIQPGEPEYTEDQYSQQYGEMIDQPLSWKTWEPKVWSKVAKAQGEAMGEHDRNIQAAAASGQPIVVDMTNMNKSSRKRLIDHLAAPNHELIAVAFDWNNDVEFLKRQSALRSQERFEQTGKRKTIPPQAFDRMVGGYEPPSNDEGWDRIIHVPAWWKDDL
jgi:predicted kinase